MAPKGMRISELQLVSRADSEKGPELPRRVSPCTNKAKATSAELHMDGGLSLHPMPVDDGSTPPDHALAGRRDLAIVLAGPGDELAALALALPLLFIDFCTFTMPLP